jgi:tRNA uridine 5-carbamoylmethylation protein Kti12
MSKIILTQGIQGSGKTTWAKAWVAEDPEHRIRINNNDITSMWGQPFGTSGLYERLKYFRRLMICRAMNENLDIVIDNMNLSNSSLKEIKEIVNEYNEYNLPDLNLDDYVIEYKDFTKVPLEVCIERDSHRENPIGKDIIISTYNKYIGNENK